MGYMYLLNTSQLVTHNQTGHCLPRFLFHNEFYVLLSFYHSSHQKSTFAKIQCH